MAFLTKKVIIGLSDRVPTEASDFATRLVLGLTHCGWDARLLLTEPFTEPITETNGSCDSDGTSYVPQDTRYERLQVASSDSWGRRWQMLERYLEENAPCIFIVTKEWSYAAMIPRLSNRVHVIAVLHSEDAMECEQIDRLGAYLNAIVTPNNKSHWNIMHRFPHLAGRMLPIPALDKITTSAPTSVLDKSVLDKSVLDKSVLDKSVLDKSVLDKNESTPDALPTQDEVALSEAYIGLFTKIELMTEKRLFIRPRSWMNLPITHANDVEVAHFQDKVEDEVEDKVEDKDPQREIDWVNHHPLWPDGDLSQAKLSDIGKRDTGNRKSDGPSAGARLDEHKIIVAIQGGRISGADIASSRLIRQLRQEGMDARVVGGRSYWDMTALDLEADIPVDLYPMRWDAPWSVQWAAMIDYLESLAPCIFLPNSDATHAAVVPRLSNRVKVVSIVHQDDPDQYAQVLRLGRYSNAIVGTSDAIVQHIAGLDSSLRSRLIHIPNGTDAVPLSPRPYTTGTPLRMIYTGRFDNYQKRCDDLLKIARALEVRRLPFELTLVGDGPDGDAIRSEARELMEQGKVRILGKLPNAAVQGLLQEQDLFLMPSAFGGSSVGLLEAMANGLVPLVSDVRSHIPELIQHGVNGFVIPVSDTDRYVQHLCSLYETPGLRQRMGLAARQTIVERGYRTEDMVARYRALFQDVVVQSSFGDFTRIWGQIAPPDYLKPQVGWRGQLDAILFRMRAQK